MLVAGVVCVCFFFFLSRRLSMCVLVVGAVVVVRSGNALGGRRRTVRRGSGSQRRRRLQQKLRQERRSNDEHNGEAHAEAHPQPVQVVGVVAAHHHGHRRLAERGLEGGAGQRKGLQVAGLGRGLLVRHRHRDAAGLVDGADAHRVRAHNARDGGLRAFRHVSPHLVLFGKRALREDRRTGRVRTDLHRVVPPDTKALLDLKGVRHVDILRTRKHLLADRAEGVAGARRPRVAQHLGRQPDHVGRVREQVHVRPVVRVQEAGLAAQRVVLVHDRVPDRREKRVLDLRDLALDARVEGRAHAGRLQDVLEDEGTHVAPASLQRDRLRRDLRLDDVGQQRRVEVGVAHDLVGRLVVEEALVHLLAARRRRQGEDVVRHPVREQLHRLGAAGRAVRRFAVRLVRAVLQGRRVEHEHVVGDGRALVRGDEVVGQVLGGDLLRETRADRRDLQGGGHHEQLCEWTHARLAVDRHAVHVAHVGAAVAEGVRAAPHDLALLRRHDAGRVQVRVVLDLLVEERLQRSALLLPRHTQRTRSRRKENPPHFCCSFCGVSVVQ
eukprot:Rhum_TRINITY_DN3397_c0_g1::Rhum_TRINITY_DN3397_c0_g1_i1::g.10625::m.10625